MGLSQVLDMDVIPHSRSVPGGVIVSKDCEDVTPKRGVDGVWDEMGLGVVALPNGPILRGPSSVEIPQADVREPVGHVEVTKDLLDNQLGSTVRVYRTRDAILGNGLNFWDSVHSTSGTENHGNLSISQNCLKKAKAAGNIVLPILRWIRHAFAYVRGGG